MIIPSFNDEYPISYPISYPTGWCTAVVVSVVSLLAFHRLLALCCCTVQWNLSETRTGTSSDAQKTMGSQQLLLHWYMDMDMDTNGNEYCCMLVY